MGVPCEEKSGTRLVLIGGGHSHQQVVLDMNPSVFRGDVQLVLISDTSMALYSGMVPGVVAGEYEVREAQVDLEQLCRRQGWNFVCSRVEEICAREKTLRTVDGTWMSFDVLSLDIGSQTRYVRGMENAVNEGAVVISTRPIGGLVEQVRELRASKDLSRKKMVIIGGGAAGVELAFSFRDQFPKDVDLTLVASDANQLGSFHSKHACHVVKSELANNDIHIVEARVQEVTRSAVVLASGNSVPYDILTLATGAQGADWVASKTDIRIDKDGFIRVRESLQSEEFDDVFAVGDCCSFPQPLPKAGVFAVRMGPILLKNLRAAMEAKVSSVDLLPTSLQKFHPQRNYLSLLATSNQLAIGSKWGLVFHGRWVRTLKSEIDRRWMAKFHVTDELLTDETPTFNGGPEEAAAELQNSDNLYEEHDQQLAILDRMENDENFRQRVIRISNRDDEW